MKPWGHWVSVTISTVKTGPADSAGSVEPIAVTSATATKKNSASRAARDEDAMAGKEERKKASLRNLCLTCPFKKSKAREGKKRKEREARSVLVGGEMVRAASFEAFRVQAERLFGESPRRDRVRLVVKYSHKKGVLVMKCTDDAQTVTFETDQQTDLKRLEKLQNRFFEVATGGEGAGAAAESDEARG
jgi:signal recognition particle subunit SRP9